MNKNNIVTCGLTNDEVQFVITSLWDPCIEVYQEKTPVDALMKHRMFALVINLDDASSVQREIIQGYYEELIWFTETIIITGEFQPEWKVTGQIIFITDLRKSVPDLRAILHGAYSKAQNNENFSQGLIRSFQLAREIRNCPGVTTARLSEDLSLSEDLVVWFIMLLRSAMESIDNDPETGGWFYSIKEPGSLEQRIRSGLADQAMNKELNGWIEYRDNSGQMLERIKGEMEVE